MHIMKRKINKLPIIALFALGAIQTAGAVGGFSVPEPGSSLTLLLLGVAGLVGLARKTK